MNYFKDAKFFTTINHLQDLPGAPTEIAFVERNNAGESNAINILTQHTRLAYISRTPGRAQRANSLELKNGGFMVDLPGYGCTQVPEAIRIHWIQLLGGYLRRRSQLIEPVLIMGARHPLRGLGIHILDFFHITDRPTHILLPKADRLLRNEQIKTLASVNKPLKSHEGHQRASVQLSSSPKKQGIEEANRIVGEWFGAHVQEAGSTQSSTILPTLQQIRLLPATQMKQHYLNHIDRPSENKGCHARIFRRSAQSTMIETMSPTAYYRHRYRLD